MTYMDQDSEEVKPARAKLEEAMVEFLRVVLHEPDAPIVVDGYLFQLQATKFDASEQDGRLPLVWGRGERQSIVTTLGLQNVLKRNIKLEMDNLNEEDN